MGLQRIHQCGGGIRRQFLLVGGGKWAHMEKSLCIVRVQPGGVEVAWRDMDVKLRLRARKACFAEAMPFLQVYRLVECRVFDHFGEEPAPEPGAPVHRDASEPFARAT